MKFSRLPKMPSLPWSPKTNNPILQNTNHLLNTEMIILEKLDGMPICVFNNGLYFNNLLLPESYKELWGWHKSIFWNIPDNHSVFTIYYDEELFVIDIRNNTERLFLPWKSIQTISKSIDLNTTELSEPCIYYSDEQLFDAARKSSENKYGISFRSNHKYINKLYGLKNAQFIN